MQQPQHHVAESWFDIKQRFEDTALIIYKERQNRSRTRSYLSYGDHRRAYAFSSYGNTAVVVHKQGRNLTKHDEKPIESQLPSPRVGHTSVYSKKHRKVIIIGGADPSGAFAETWEIDVATLQCKKVQFSESCFTERYEHTAFIPADGEDNVVVFGGAAINMEKNDVQVYYIPTRSWHSVDVKGSAPSPRTHHTTGTAGNSLVVFSGGKCGSDPVLDREVHLYDSKKEQWSILHVEGVPPTPRHGHQMVSIGNKLYVHGGLAGKTFYNDLHILDENHKWQKVEQSKDCPSPRAAHGAVAVDKDIYIFGGLGANGAENDFWKFNTDTLKWTKISSDGCPPSARLDFAMTIVELPAVFQDVCSSSNRELYVDIKNPGAANCKNSNVAGNIVDKLSDLRLEVENSSGSCSKEKTINDEAETKDRIRKEEIGQACNSKCLKADKEEREKSSAQQMIPFILIHGGMDTHGEIFDDFLLFKLL